MKNKLSGQSNNQKSYFPMKFPELEKSAHYKSEGRKLFIGAIKSVTTEKNLKDYLQNYGNEFEVVLQTNKKNRHRGFAFLTVYSQEMYDKQQSCDHILNGRILDIKSAVAKEEICNEDMFPKMQAILPSNNSKVGKKLSFKNKISNSHYKTSYDNSTELIYFKETFSSQNLQNGSSDVYDSYTQKFLKVKEIQKNQQNFQEKNMIYSNNPHTKENPSQMNYQNQQSQNFMQNNLNSNFGYYPNNNIQNYPNVNQGYGNIQNQANIANLQQQIIQQNINMQMANIQNMSALANLNLLNNNNFNFMPYVDTNSIMQNMSNLSQKIEELQQLDELRKLEATTNCLFSDNQPSNKVNNNLDMFIKPKAQENNFVMHLEQENLKNINMNQNQVEKNDITNFKAENDLSEEKNFKNDLFKKTEQTFTTTGSGFNLKDGINKKNSDKNRLRLTTKDSELKNCTIKSNEDSDPSSQELNYSQQHELKNLFLNSQNSCSMSAVTHSSNVNSNDNTNSLRSPGLSYGTGNNNKNVKGVTKQRTNSKKVNKNQEDLGTDFAYQLTFDDIETPKLDGLNIPKICKAPLCCPKNLNAKGGILQKQPHFLQYYNYSEKLAKKDSIGSFSLKDNTSVQRKWSANLCNELKDFDNYSKDIRKSSLQQDFNPRLCHKASFSSKNDCLSPTLIKEIEEKEKLERKKEWMQASPNLKDLADKLFSDKEEQAQTIIEEKMCKDWKRLYQKAEGCKWQEKCLLSSQEKLLILSIEDKEAKDNSKSSKTGEKDGCSMKYSDEMLNNPVLATQFPFLDCDDYKCDSQNNQVISEGKIRANTGPESTLRKNLEEFRDFNLESKGGLTKSLVMNQNLSDCANLQSINKDIQFASKNDIHENNQVNMVFKKNAWEFSPNTRDKLKKKLTY